MRACGVLCIMAKGSVIISTAHTIPLLWLSYQALWLWIRDPQGRVPKTRGMV